MIVFLFKLHIFFVRIVHYYGKLFSAGHCVRCNVCLLAFKEIKGSYKSINDGLECIPCICSINSFITAEELKKSLSVGGGVTFPWVGSQFYNRKVTHGSLFHGGHFSN